MTYDGKLMISGVVDGKMSALNLYVTVASGFWRRLYGLMFTKELEFGQGLILTSCGSIHTCFMNYSIDVIFLSKERKILKIVKKLRPWKWCFARRGEYVLEVNCGEPRTASLRVGDTLVW